MASSVLALMLERDQRLELYCYWHECRHRAWWDPAAVVARFGIDTPLPEIERRLVCSECGARGRQYVHCRPSIEDYYAWVRRREIARAQRSPSWKALRTS